MQDAAAIEAINFEQLVTATDHLLIRSGRVSKRRPSPPSARTSQPIARGSDPDLERTIYVRSSSTRAQVFAFVVVIPALVGIGIAIGLAALL